jgi:hypothetical protein
MMEENVQPPVIIAEIVERKKQALREERRQKEEAERLKLQKLEEDGKAKFDAYFLEAMQKVPEYLRSYYDFVWNAPDYVRIGQGWDRVENYNLHFLVPGLAAIAFDPQKNTWKSQYANWSESWDEGPRLQFGDHSNWNDDLDYVLCLAQKATREYQEYQAQYAAQQEEQAKERERREQMDQRIGVEIVAECEQENAKEKALFDAIKNDPITIHFLKAFVLLRDERGHFEQRLYEADEALYSVEDRWSRKAADLRRQAEEIERRAEDERYRLQGDLDDAEAKLKKAERGW